MHTWYISSKQWELFDNCLIFQVLLTPGVHQIAHQEAGTPDVHKLPPKDQLRNLFAHQVNISDQNDS